MKLVGNLQAIVRLKGAEEETSPASGIPVAAMVTTLIKKFKFTAAPGIANVGAATFPGTPPIQFGNGSLSSDGRLIGIHLLTMMQGVIALGATSTDDADIGMNAVVQTLNSEFGFRITSDNVAKTYVSSCVIEFDADIRQNFEMISRITDLLERAMPKTAGDHAVALKRLSFGRYTAEDSQSVETLEKADFVLEIRVGQPFEKNWFFSLAPVSTQEHIRLLELIEAILLKRN